MQLKFPPSTFTDAVSHARPRASFLRRLFGSSTSDNPGDTLLVHNANWKGPLQQSTLSLNGSDFGNSGAERDCLFECLAIVVPFLRYNGDMGRREADIYRAKIQSFPIHLKAALVLNNVFLAPLDPHSPVRLGWDTLVLLGILLVSVLMPFYIAFDIRPSGEGAGLAVVDSIIMVVFVLDVLMNFRYAFLRGAKTVVRSYQKIAKRYLRGWFTVDVMSALPVLWVFGGSDTPLISSDFLHFVRLLSVVKALKLMQMNVLPEFEKFAGRSIIRIVRLVIIGGFMAHLMACIFYAISYLPGSVDSSHNWRCVELEVCSDEGDERDLFEHYIVSLFWSFTTITTVGYGDIVPVNKYERLISILCMVAGVGLFGYLMGTLSSMVQKMNMDELLELERQDALQAFLAYRALPQHLSDRITEYYKFVWERELRLQERDWLHGLSSSLRTEAVLYMYQDAVEHIPFLHDKNIHFIADMMLQLRPETYVPLDVISCEGEPRSCMYFVSRGVADVCRRLSDERAQDILMEQMKREGPVSRFSADNSSPGAPASAIPTGFSDEFDLQHQTSKVMEEEARQRIIESMSRHSIRKVKASQLKGGVLRRGNPRCSGDDEEETDSEGGAQHRSFKERAANGSVPEKTIYIIPEDKFSAYLRKAEKAKAGKPTLISLHKFKKVRPVPEQSFDQRLAMMRRATQVHTDIEMIEAYSLANGHANSYMRIGAARAGTYFGEYSCLLGTHQNITAIAVDICEVYSLKHSSLELLLKDWPSLREEFMLMLNRRRASHVNRQSKKAVSADKKFGNKKRLKTLVQAAYQLQQLQKASVTQKNEDAPAPGSAPQLNRLDSNAKTEASYTTEGSRLEDEPTVQEDSSARVSALRRRRTVQCAATQPPFEPPPQEMLVQEIESAPWQARTGSRAVTGFEAELEAAALQAAMEADPREG